MISANVIVTASGKLPAKPEQVAAKTIEVYRPKHDAVEEVREGLRKLGFEVSEFAGLSFAIGGPKDLFEKVFGVQIVVDARGAASASTGKKSTTLDLPLAKLGPDLARLIAAVSLSRAPDFGPDNP